MIGNPSWGFTNRKRVKRDTAIAYRDGEEITKTPPRERMAQIDQLPFPARHLLPMDLYLRESNLSEFTIRKPQMAMASSRGCPQKCVFCTVRAVWGRDWTGRSPESVVDEIEFLQKKYNYLFYFR